MNTLPPSQVATYGMLWEQADLDRDGVVGSNDAVTFFSKSGLTPDALGLVWSQVNPTNAPSLTPDQFVYACQLISMAQAGSSPDLGQLQAIASQPGVEIPVPNFAGVVLAPAPVVAAAPPTFGGVSGFQPANDFSALITPSADNAVWGTNESLHVWMGYFNDFDTDRDGFVGPEVTSFLQQSGLPVTTLGTIWDLADVNKDGRLDVQEFCCAMALISGVKEGNALPSTIPASLIQLVWPNGAPPALLVGSFPGAASAAAAASPVPVITSATPTLLGSTPGFPSVFAVTPDELSTDRGTFAQYNVGGFIEGNTAVTLFSQSGLSQVELSLVYSLADMDGDSKLSEREFFVAMKLMRARMNGTPLPTSVPAELFASLGGPSPVVSVTGSAGGVSPQQQIATLTAQNQQLRTELQEKNQHISQLEAQVAQLQAQLSAPSANANPFGAPAAGGNPFGAGKW